jgi:hypothetical protein
MGVFETLRDWIPFKKVSNETDLQKLFDASLKASEKYWKASTPESRTRRFSQPETSAAAMHGFEPWRRWRPKDWRGLARLPQRRRDAMAKSLPRKDAEALGQLDDEPCSGRTTPATADRARRPPIQAGMVR